MKEVASPVSSSSSEHPERIPELGYEEAHFLARSVVPPVFISYTPRNLKVTVKTVAPLRPKEVPDELSSTDSEVEVSSETSSTQGSRASRLKHFVVDDDSELETLDDGKGNTAEQLEEVGVSAATLLTFLGSIN